MKYVVKVVVYTDITTADCCIVRPLFRDDFEHENFGLAIQENCESHDSKCTEQQTSMLFLVIPKKISRYESKGRLGLELDTYHAYIFWSPWTKITQNKKAKTRQTYTVHGLEQENDNVPQKWKNRKKIEHFFSFLEYVAYLRCTLHEFETSNQ